MSFMLVNRVVGGMLVATKAAILGSTGEATTRMAGTLQDRSALL